MYPPSFIVWPNNSKPPATAHTAPKGKPRAINLFALPCGGFALRDPFYGREDQDRLVGARGDYCDSPALAAFTTLDQALEWLRANMAQPAAEQARK